MKSIKRTFAFLAVLFILFSPPAVALTDPSTGSTPASSETNDKIFAACTGKAAESPICKDKNNGTENPAIGIINTAANVVAVATGLVAVIMIMVSGFTLITSAGNTEKVTNSRRRITYAVVGVIVVALAWTVTRFVTSKVIQ